MRAASSGVRPPSSASGTSAQPSGTNTTYLMATDRNADRREAPGDSKDP